MTGTFNASGADYAEYDLQPSEKRKPHAAEIDTNAAPKSEDISAERFDREAHDAFMRGLR